MTEKYVTVKTRAGIHLRPASLIAELAAKFSSKILLIKESENATMNAKSPMGILVLKTGYNDKLLIRAEGEDEEAAVEALFNFFERRFGEE
ncbi:MAG: HPr family phosphocarrier protein [Spirochaetales bacterium]|jgi:phosphocarrier protein|nr:HPr family phosphocarrier protein [Spirochaetales bacterium]